MFSETWGLRNDVVSEKMQYLRFESLDSETTDNLSKMATAALANRASTDRTWNLLRQSFSFLRSFSAAPSASSSSSLASSNPTASKKPKRRKKNLFEVSQFLPNYGLGYHMAKTHWTGVSYEITKINLYKDGRHGKAWGLVHKDGLPAADAPKKISGVHKRCWRYIPSSKKTEEKTPRPEVQKHTPNPEVQAA